MRRRRRGGVQHAHAQHVGELGGHLVHRELECLALGCQLQQRNAHSRRGRCSGAGELVTYIEYVRHACELAAMERALTRKKAIEANHGVCEKCSLFMVRNCERARFRKPKSHTLFPPTGAPMEADA